MSPGGLHRNPNQVNLRSTGTPKGSFSKQDSFINGSMQPTQFNAFQKIDQRIVNAQGIEEVLGSIVFILTYQLKDCCVAFTVSES